MRRVYRGYQHHDGEMTATANITFTEMSDTDVSVVSNITKNTLTQIKQSDDTLTESLSSQHRGSRFAQRKTSARNLSALTSFFCRIREARPSQLSVAGSCACFTANSNLTLFQGCDKELPVSEPLPIGFVVSFK